MEYEINTINVQTLIEKAKRVKRNGNIQYVFEYTVNDNINDLFDDIEENKEDNALFYQLNRLLSGNAISEDPKVLKRHIICLDFSLFFDNGGNGGKYGEYIKTIFGSKFNADDAKGISITYVSKDRKNDETITYVPYDKSSSMAKKCQIYFIDKEYKTSLDKRLLLGFGFKDIGIISSKYFAYRGLYLTSSDRINIKDEHGKLVLNEDTFIVIEDEAVKRTIAQLSKYDNMNLSSGIKSAITDDNSAWSYYKHYCNDKTLEITAFDGEGLISPEYSELINKKLGLFDEKKNKGRATSYQVRMPFVKGMLHEVDFHKFFIKEFDLDDLTIEDAFGVERSLKKAQIIITTSMLKCWKWAKKLPEYTEKQADFMRDYFREFENFDHSLYICNRSDTLGNNGMVNLNYQFVRTMNIDNALMESFINETIRKIENVETDYLLSEEQENDPDKKRSSQKAVWMEAYQKNKAFINTDKVANAFIATKKSMFNDIGRARFIVAGENRYLSSDLFAFLLHLFEISIEACSGNNTENGWYVGKYARRLKKLHEERMYSNKVYLPCPRNTKNTGNGTVLALLRNPHLSRNELGLVKQYCSDKYNEYFGHLDSVLMTGYRSVMPMVVGGADFDGDIVKVIYEPKVIDAIKKEAYEEMPDGHTNSRLVRKYPIVMIPSVKTKENSNKNNHQVTYDLIEKTFSNSTGQLSNLSYKFSSNAKIEGDDSINERCAECTIITGLDIDAAKNGGHPTRSIIRLKTKYDKLPKKILQTDIGKRFDANDYYINFKNYLKNVGAYNISITKKESSCFVLDTADIVKMKNYDKTKTVNYIIEKKPWNNKSSRSSKMKFYAYDIKEINDPLFRLPYVFSEKYEKNQKSLFRIKKTKGKYFTFEDHKDWKVDKNNARYQELTEIIEEYLCLLKLNRIISSVKAASRNRNYKKQAADELKKIWGSLNHILPDSNLNGADVATAIDATFTYLENFFFDAKDTTDITGISGYELLNKKLDSIESFYKKELKEKITEDKRDGNEQIKFLAECTEAIIYNPRYGGHDITTITILRHILMYLEENTLDYVLDCMQKRTERVTKKGESIVYSPYDEWVNATENSAYSDKLWKIYDGMIKSTSERKSGGSREKEISKAFRKELLLGELFKKNDKKDVVRYVYSYCKEADSKGWTFLWDVVPEDMTITSVKKDG